MLVAWAGVMSYLLRHDSGRRRRSASGQSPARKDDRVALSELKLKRDSSCFAPGTTRVNRRDVARRSSRAAPAAARC